MTAQLVAARGDSPMATSLVDPAPAAATSTPAAVLVVPSTDLATTTLDSSTPIGQTLSGGDGSFVSIITTPSPPAFVEEVHDTASDFCPELAVDLTIDATVTAVSTDVSFSTAKASEVLLVIHDPSPDCMEMAHVTCSTECSHQVATIDIVNEVRDATAATFLEPVVDLNDTTATPPMVEPVDQEEYQVVATTSLAVDITIDVKLATPVSRELSRHGPDITNHYTDDADASQISLVTLPVESVPSFALLTSSLPPVVVHQSDALTHVRRSTEYHIHEVDQGIKQQPWPPPIRVQIATDDDMQVLGIAANDDNGSVWWPPDYQPGIWSQVQKWLLLVPRCSRNFAACAASGSASGIAILESTDCAICLEYLLPTSHDITYAGYFCTSEIVQTQSLQVMIFLDKGTTDSQVVLKCNLALHGWPPDSLCNTTTLPAYKTLQWFLDSFCFPGCISISAFHSHVVVWCSDTGSLASQCVSAGIPSLAGYLYGGNLASHIISSAVSAYFNHGHRHSFSQWSMFAYLGTLEFSHALLYINSLLRWKSGRRTGMGIATKFSGDYTQSTNFFCFLLPTVKIP